MQISDKPKFANLMTSLCELHNRKLSPELIAIYWHALKRFDFVIIQKCMSSLICDTNIGQFMPKPADVIALIEGKTGTRAIKAWNKVLWAIRHIGAWDSVQFDDHKIHAVIIDMGGWTQLCRRNTNDLPFLAREFERLYCIEITEGREIYPHMLHGKLEQVTAYCNGNSVNEIRFVGDNTINATTLKLSHINS
jgi:hypothetical protein